MNTEKPALTLAQTRVLATVIKTTKYMLELADQGEWGAVAELESLRREDLQFCFDIPADEDKAELVAEALAVLLHLNEELMNRLVSARDAARHAVNSEVRNIEAMEEYRRVGRER